MLNITNLRKIKIITIMKYYYMYTRMAKVKKNDLINYWWECGEIKPCIHCWWECKVVQLLWKMLSFLKKLDINIIYHPDTQLLNTCPKEMKIYIQMKICTWMSTAVVFVIVIKKQETTNMSINVITDMIIVNG